MQLGLLLVVVAIPFLEIALLIKVGQLIGFWLTLMLVVLSAAFGSYVIYEQGFQVMGRALEAMNRGKAPLAPVIDGMFVVLAGVLLIVPGFISDAMGLALLAPVLRHRFAVFCLRRLMRSGSFRMFSYGERGRPASGPQQPAGGQRRDQPRGPERPPPAGEGPIIEGEFQHLDERTVDQDRPRKSPPDTDNRPRK